MIRRREFITLLGGAAAWPLAAGAQKSALPVIGFLNSESRDTSTVRLRGFHQGLNESGYVEGQNVVVEYRWADGYYDRLPAMAADLIRRNVDVIAANGPAALPAKSATTTIPTVFFTGGDPIALGLVASRNRPGGNRTGVMLLNSEVESKRLELLHELVPVASEIAFLVNPTDADTATNTSSVQAVARRLGIRLHVLHASAERDLDTVAAAIAQSRIGGLMIASHPFFLNQIDRLAALTVSSAVPAISQYRQFVTAGSLISYGANPTDGYRLVGVYSGRILMGENPADLPVLQPKFELTINLKAAKALGLTVPTSLLARADEVIE